MLKAQLRRNYVTDRVVGRWARACAAACAATRSCRLYIVIYMLLQCMPTASTQPDSMAHTVIIGGLGVNSSIALAQLNKQTGQLTITDRWMKVAGPSPAFMAWQKNSSQHTAAVTNIWVANHAAKKGEAATAVQLYPPYAQQTGSVWTDDPCHIALHPSGRWAATASYDAGTVGVVEIIQESNPTVEISQLTAAAAAGATSLPPAYRLGKHTTYPTDVIGKAAHEAAFSPDGSLLCVPCLKSDYIRMFKFDAKTGALTPHNYPAATAAAAAAAAPANDAPASSGDAGLDDINPVMLSPAEVKHSSSSNAAEHPAASSSNMARLPAGSGPRHIIFHPRLPVAYVLNELSSTIARFDCDLNSGGHLMGDLISNADRIVSMLPPGVSATMQGGGELAITNDGHFLYASNRGLSDENPEKPPGVSNIVIFGVNGSTGALHPVAWDDGEGDVNFPRHFSLSPDENNTFLLVANQKSDSVTIFKRDVGSGLLSKACTVSVVEAGVQQPSFVAVLS